ncbi:MAG: FeoB-associated Cys-rich membrane protein [Firmicutes bacterium]|nr:FeoB-associated Cys-rich membrane protein [Bacillota bacterium]
MNVLDYILLGIIAVAAIFAVRHMKTNKGCCGDCSRCGTNCNKREEDFHENHER